MKHRKVLLWVIAGIVVAAAAAVLVLRHHEWGPGSMAIRGAVIRRDTDTRKQLPVADALVTATDGALSVTAESDASGYFELKLPRVVWPGRILKLNIQHANYEPLEMQVHAGIREEGKKLYVAALTPTFEEPEATHGGHETVVSNIRVRYTVNSQTEDNIGTAVRTFQVVNEGNVACNGRPPCSPNGAWKASTGALSLDAGPGNEFRNVRASCIAGPCPFTKIDLNGNANGERNITISALDWSDTATFLVEAEVLHTAIGSRVRESYPVIFGPALNFTLPPTQEGVSIEADVDGAPMVFPLGPELYLSWATCTAGTNDADKRTTMAYRCELKPGYKF